MISSIPSDYVLIILLPLISESSIMIGCFKQYSGWLFWGWSRKGRRGGYAAIVISRQQLHSLFTLFVYARPLCLILTSLFALDPTKSHSCIFSTYLGHVSRFAKADSDKETKEEQVGDLRKTVEFLIMLPLLLWKCNTLWMCLQFWYTGKRRRK